MTYERLIKQAQDRKPAGQVKELDDIFYMRTLKKYKRMMEK